MLNDLKILNPHFIYNFKCNQNSSLNYKAFLSLSKVAS